MKPTPVPAPFLEEMCRLLGAEFEAFQSVYAQPASSGLRVNTLKVSPGELLRRLPFELKPLPWTESGFEIREAQDKITNAPGRHPYHAAGLYYLQEPSAMLVPELLGPEPGERVLDLCAAPGGKATHLASLLRNQGLLVVNEIQAGRAWELAENLERWGARNAVVTHESPERLAENWAGFFDKVLVDAPCSGEGMFRKSEPARQDWSPELVRSCALRQAAILKSAVALLKPGGLLAYSTCTFNPHENEAVLAAMLGGFPELEIVAAAAPAGVMPGRPDWLDDLQERPGLQRALRLWPHQAPGEGHFAALLRKADGPARAALKTSSPAAGPDRIGRRPTAAEAGAFEDFCAGHLEAEVSRGLLDPGGLRVLGSYLYLLPPDLPALAGLRAIHPGWWLGVVKAGKERHTQRFEPSHALALGLPSMGLRRRLEFGAADSRLKAYLHGETLSVDGDDGWVLVCVDGFGLGWGKAVAGKLKNFYPRGLRTP